MEPGSLAVLERAKEAGLTVCLEGSDLKVKGQPTPQAKAIVESLKEHKEEVITYLRQYSDSQPPSLERPPANEQELRRLIDWTADPEEFARWLDWAMTRTDYQ